MEYEQLPPSAPEELFRQEAIERRSEEARELAEFQQRIEHDLLQETRDEAVSMLPQGILEQPPPQINPHVQTVVNTGGAVIHGLFAAVLGA